MSSPVPDNVVSAAEANADSRRSALSLTALAIGAFGIGTTEFGPMGMLPTIAAGMEVSIPTAGMVVSAYAIGVTVAAPIMTLLLARWPRRRSLIMAMAIFTIGNLLSALAPNYASLLVARVITSLNHGVFFGIGAVVAASLVPRHKQASAVATMFLGLTLANIGGVPAAAWLGQVLGWRESFAAMSALGILAMLAVRLALPVGTAGQVPNVRAELRVIAQPAVLMGIAATIMSSSAMFTLYTYINPILKALTGGGEGYITAMLMLIGVGLTVGNAVGGKLADRSIEKALLGIFALLALSTLAFPWLAANRIGAAAGLFVWGIAAFAVVPPLQMWVMRAAAGAPGLASSINIGVFNFGNAVGAVIGGLVLQAGLGYAAVPVVGSVLAVLGLVVVLVHMQMQRRQPGGVAESCA